MLLLGLFFNSLISYGISDIISEFVANMSGLLLLIIPILTMRSMAEDKKNGTEVLLLTSPVRVTEIVLGKYFASFCVFLVMTAASIFPLIVIIAETRYYADNKLISRIHFDRSGFYQLRRLCFFPH